MPFHATVLLVDDDSVIRQVMAASLREIGFRVFEAGSSEEARRIAHPTIRVDVLITDVRLPGSMDGWELALSLVLERPGLKVVLATALSADELAHALPSGTLLLNKPFSLEDLAEAVGRVLVEV